MDFARKAREHGLEVVAFQRLFDKNSIQQLLFGALENDNMGYKVILKDCRSVNPTVVPEDLFTRILIMVLRKAT